MATTLGVGVLGTGFGQKVHIPGLQSHHRTEVVAVYHRDLAKAQAVAEAHHIPHACDSMDEILALTEVQAVTVATPPFLHHAMATAAIKAGKHVLLEKPTALNVAEALEIQALAQQHQRVVTLDFEFRFVPAWQRLSELLAEGYVGNLRFVKVDWTVPSRADASRPWNWYAQKALGGGALGAFASHSFDYITWLFGPIARLSARLSSNPWMPTTPVASPWIWPAVPPARWRLAPWPMPDGATGWRSTATKAPWFWAAIT